MGRRKKDGVYIGILGILIAVAAVLCIVLLVVMYMDNHGMLGKTGEKAGEQQEDVSDNALSEPADEAPDEMAGEMPDEFADQMPVDTQAADNGSSVPEQSLDIMPMHDDVDIAALRSDINPDIYSWIYIPQSGIDAPILQNSEDGYYSDHNEKGEPDANGAIYTLSLNKKDFSDNVTVVYGYNDGSEEGFSKLDLFADPVFFENHPFIYIYTEDGLLVYQVYAAYESDDKNILVYYQPDEEDKFMVYLYDSFGLLGLDGNARKEIWPTTDDRIITLSTAIKGKDDRRYLVQGKLYGTADLGGR